MLDTTQGGRAANQTVLPHQDKNPLPLVAGRIGKGTVPFSSDENRDSPAVVSSPILSRRNLLKRAGLGMLSLTVLGEVGCRSTQTAQVVKPGEQQMVGSHSAGNETYGPLVDEAVGKLLSRHQDAQAQPASLVKGAQPGQLRVCFVGVENKSIEEMGDFKDDLFQRIDSRILQSQVFQSVSRRYVEAGLQQSHLRPDDLMIPNNMRTFSATMEQMQQPFDFLLFATVTSGTTRSNADYQRNYLMTLELINVHNGQADKEFAELEKKYNVSTMAKIKGMFN